MYANNEPTARLTIVIFHPAAVVRASYSRYVRSFASNRPSIYKSSPCQPPERVCMFHHPAGIGHTWMSRMYAFALPRPRFGRSGESSGTRERTAPNAPDLPLSLSTQAYGSIVSTQRSLVFGPEAARRSFSSLSIPTSQMQ